MSFMLRVRLNDESPWGPPTAYKIRRQRDRVAAFNRIICQVRTHSWQETPAEQKARRALGHIEEESV